MTYILNALTDFPADATAPRRRLYAKSHFAFTRRERAGRPRAPFVCHEGGARDSSRMISYFINEAAAPALLCTASSNLK